MWKEKIGVARLLIKRRKKFDGPVRANGMEEISDGK